MNNTLILADTHVHFHECFDIGRLLDGAQKNFQTERDRTKAGSPFAGFLFLTETKPNGWFLTHFNRVVAENKEEKIGLWSLLPTQEDFSLISRSTNGDVLFLISGRQIKTAENLEVLALGTIEPFTDGTPIETLIRQINLSGALAVIPWGVGKWLGPRGKQVNTLIQQNENIPFFLGDNGNRPIFWSQPNLFKEAIKKGILILPGSDPLPFPSEIERIGRIGLKLSGPIHPDYPCRDLKKLLFNPISNLETYGALESPWRFFRNQLKMNLHQRAGCQAESHS
jgi:hypothetical protein